MRIAQVSTLASPVARDTGGHGSVESLVWSLTEGLTAAGHEVTVFGAADSDVSGELVATLPGSYAQNGAPGDWQLCEWINLSRAVEQSDRFDVVHSHAYLWGLPLEPLCRTPMVHTLHVWPYDDEALLRRTYPRATVTAISRAQWHRFPDLTPSHVVPHGIDPSGFSPSYEPDGYACYFGRFSLGKGALDAIAMARKASLPIVLAGPENEWFTEHIAPLVDGSLVTYVGAVSGADRSDLLGGAAVLLAPYREPEPFGLVLIEAMMCGTPVVTTNIGAAPEIVEQGITGLVVHNETELAPALLDAMKLDRTVVRRRAEQRWSVSRMVEGYMAVYRSVAADRRR